MHSLSKIGESGVRSSTPALLYSHSRLFGLCVTCWLGDLNGFSMFFTIFPYIIETLEAIGHELHLEKYPEWRDWDCESKRKAEAPLGNNHFFVLLSLK